MSVPQVTESSCDAGGDYLPASFAQQRLWFLAQIEGVSEAYNVPLRLRVRGHLNDAALRWALDRIQSRHEVLRTTFVMRDGELYQRISHAEDGRFILLEHDLRQHPSAEEELHRLAEHEASASFDLEHGPLIRGRLVRLSDDEHALLLTLHHIASDDWSMGVFCAELSALYAAFLRGEDDPLPALEIQYADYAVWQREWLTGERLEQQAEYWRGALAGAPALLELPTDHPRPVQQDNTGAFAEVQLGAALTAGLRDLSRRHGSTLYMTLMAGWATLLSRLSGQTDVVIGTPVANRGRAEIENLIGFFANTLALRIDLSASPTVKLLLEQVKRQVLAAQQHQDIPFEQVVEMMRPARSLAYSPLFQVMFSWGNLREETLTLPGLEAQLLAASHRLAKFDMTLLLKETAETIVGGIAYTTSLFEPQTVERYLGYFRTVLEAMVADDTLAVDRLPLLSASERHQLLYAWNATQAEFHADQRVHELFEAQVAKSPDAIAVAFEDRQLSYAELNARANQLAHHLIATGLRPEARVAIALERSLETVVAMLAILKAGGAFVPIDPAYPAERLSFMIEDSAPDMLLTQRAVLPLLGHLPDKLPILTLDDSVPPWAVRPATNPEHASVGLTGSNLAYVIYTSGSTGRPKGVLIEHGPLAEHCVECQEFYGLNQEDRVLQFASPSFDAAIEQILPPLLSGARVVLRDAQLWSPSEFHQKLDELGLTVINLPPAFWQQLAEQWANAAEPVSAHSVRLVIIGGDAMSVQTLRLWQQTAFNGVRLLNAYGPTETVITATSFEIPAFGPGQARFERLPIGRKRGARRLYVVDRSGQLVPMGVPGELLIGGTALARGYHNRAELTAEKFIADPFSSNAGDRLYRTGDLVRYLPDGNIEFLGRVDQQVKIRGFRIELGEIEARLREHAALRDAVVLLREDKAADKRLVAYYVNHETIDPEQLRSYLAASLPEYMVPAAYVRLDALPLTTNGKLDRKALPAPHDEAFARTAYEAPQGETETALAAIWSELLGIEKISRSDDFFELGGHSLLAIRLIERMRRAGMQVRVQTLFTTPRLADVAASLGSEADIVDVPPNKIPEQCSLITPEMLPLVQLTETQIAEIVASVPGGAANVQDIYPLAPLQEGILFHHRMQVEGDTYLLVQLYSMDSRPRLDAYVQALQAVVDRHDTLRTAVFWEGLPTAVQVVWRNAPLHIEEIALDPGQGDAAEQLCARFNPRHFSIDVRQAPLLRLYIAFDFTQQRWLALQLSHHLVGDHTSLDNMLAEVQAHLLGQGARLPKPLPFRNLVAQVQFGVSQQEHEAFFRKMLADIDEPTVPFGLLDVYGDGSNIEEARIRLDADLAHRLRANARRLGVTAASLFHLAWAQVLAKASGREDVVFGTVLFGRMQGGAGADTVMGLFNNTLPIRISIGEEGVVASVRKTHALLAYLLRHEHASLALAQRCSAVSAPAPLFSSIFNYRHSVDADQAPSIETLRAWDGIRRLRIEERTNYPLVLSVSDLGEAFSLNAQTLASIGPERVCALMQTALASLVQALEHAPDSAVRALSVLPASERHQLLYAWNATQAEFPADTCVHELFEQQVAKSPDAIAVVFEDQQLSYAELNRRANRLAHYLRERGVGPDLRVAICVERSFEMVVALLAVLKAGGAYVPLDPAYPAERLGYMIQDAGPIALLTQRHLQPLFPELDPKLPIIDMADSSGWAQMPDTNPDPRVIGLTPQHLAYVIYTSGSTGQPKGVMLQHDGLSNRLDWMQSAYAMNGGDTVLQKTPFGFDVSVWEFFWTLLVGARLVMARPEGHKEPEYLVDVMRRNNVTTAHFVPSMLQVFLEHPGAALCTSLTRVICSGEALPAHLVRRFQALLPHAALHNLYGPTEATVDVTAWSCPPGFDGSIVPIGQPIANTRMYVLDAQREPTPIGVSGELYIAGVQVARGYLNRPELTAEKFLTDPFTSHAANRMYRTGDVARWLADGNIEYLGRNDHQVKIRGFRIELGEIEVRLRECDAVRDALVIAREDASGEKRLVAYVVADHDDQLASHLRAYLEAHLPGHMVPAAFVRLDAFPVTANGKLDRKALPSPDDEAYARAAYEAPQGEIEIALAAIWSDLLRVERISRHDNFFNLGGHSFLALRVISEIYKTLAGHVSVPAFFLCPTIAGLAKELAHGHHPKPRVVTLRAGTAGLPIYFMGARPEEFRVAQLIGGDRRIFTVDVPILTSWLAAFEAAKLDALPTIEQLGMLYGEILAEHVGSTPCVIAGYSLGGKIALEAARVLERVGGNVAFVLLLDARAFTSSSYTLGPALESLAWIWRGGDTKQASDALPLQRLGTSLSETWTLARWLLSRVPNSVKHRVDHIRRRFGHVTQGSVRDSLPSGYFDEEGKPVGNLLFNRFSTLLGRLWHPRPLDAAGVLIRADNSENTLPGRDLTGGWGGLFTRGLEIVQTTGDHHSMVTEENAASLAEQMNLILARYEAAQTAQGGMSGSNPDQRAAADGQRCLGPTPVHIERSIA
jgi:amino acid adenylation domain-containing protein